MALFIFLFSSAAIAINNTVTHYIGNQYVPYEQYYLIVPLILMLAGSYLMTDWDSIFTNLMKRTIFLYLFLCLLIFFTTAIQYTPFSPIDSALKQIDGFLLVDTNALLNWVYQHPLLSDLLTLSYAALNWELVFVFCLIVLTNDEKSSYEFYFIMLFTALIGFVFYYFFPTLAPASLIQNNHFFKQQYDTALKFHEIHQHMKPSTLEGGLIAMPSFHSIWALLCQYYLRRWPLLWFIALPLNALILVACVLLGWHYLVDILAAASLVGLSIFILKRINRPTINQD